MVGPCISNGGLGKREPGSVEPAKRAPRPATVWEPAGGRLLRAEMGAINLTARLTFGCSSTSELIVLASLIIKLAGSRMARRQVRPGKPAQLAGRL